MLKKIILLFAGLIIISCSNKDKKENFSLELVTDNTDLNMKLYYQDDFVSNYNEKKIAIAKNDKHKYFFSIDNESLHRIRIDFDNLKSNKVLIKKLSIKKGGNYRELMGKDILDNFKFNSQITPIIKNKELILVIKDKKDPFFVSKNLNILFL
ncbi:hypothetical protein [Empedobacter brevis]|uniref:hypothetical protein n=1 Tax=Empedobacter brevis TaxID=247 RepID=UPI00334261C6